MQWGRQAGSSKLKFREGQLLFLISATREARSHVPMMLAKLPPANGMASPGAFPTTDSPTAWEPVGWFQAKQARCTRGPWMRFASSFV